MDGKHGRLTAMEVNEMSQKEQDNMAQNSSLWGTSVSPAPREKEISKEGDIDITEIHSYPVPLDFGTWRSDLLPPG